MGNCYKNSFKKINDLAKKINEISKKIDEIIVTDEEKKESEENIVKSSKPKINKISVNTFKLE